jgi:peptidoglycan hydrolase-like protein with peptidoglycan-binding domain
MENDSKLYPLFLDKGSHGAAVLPLQGLMQMTGCATEKMLRDGDYGIETSESVKNFQRMIYAVEVDGNFGPGTRLAAQVTLSWNINSIQAVAGEDTFWIGPDQPGEWHRPVTDKKS